MQKHQHQIKLPSARQLGPLSLVGLVTLLGALLLPVTRLDANAETMTSEVTTKTTAYLYSMISVALTDEINIDLTPKSSGSLSIGTAKLNVSTNNTTGYSIYLATVDGSNQLNPIDDSQTFEGDNTTYSIKPLTTAATEADYLDNKANLNTWSYALTNSSASDAPIYQGLKDSSSNLVYHTEATTSSDSYDLNIAVAVDANLPAGGYRNGLIVSAVANPISISGFKSIYYMQDMTPTICADAKEHEEGQLVDKRDNKIYWVGKLKDGNCWMTQNLDLDLSTDVALTPEDTNVTEPWTPEVGTSMEIYQVENLLDRGQYIQNSYDPGKVVPNFANKISYGSKCTRSEGPKVCPDEYTDVGSGYSANLETGEDMQVVNKQSKSYDAHYLIGNFYAFNATVVGKASIDVSEVAYQQDICPAGWRLPSGNTSKHNTNAAMVDNDFYRLFAAYGWDSGYQPNIGWASFIYTPLNSNKTSQKIYAKPLYYAATGGLNFPNLDNNDGENTFRSGTGTKYWTNIQYGDIVERNLQYSTATAQSADDPSGLYPGSAGSFPFMGMYVRCIAK